MAAMRGAFAERVADIDQALREPPASGARVLTGKVPLFQRAAGSYVWSVTQGFCIFFPTKTRSEAQRKQGNRFNR